MEREGVRCHHIDVVGGLGTQPLHTPWAVRGRDRGPVKMQLSSLNRMAPSVSSSLAGAYYFLSWVDHTKSFQNHEQDQAKKYFAGCVSIEIFHQIKQFGKIVVDDH